MESNSVAKKSSGFRETVFTNCHDNFVRPEKPIVRRDLSGIEQNFGSSLTVNMSQPQSEFLPFNPKIQTIRNVNMSKKKDEIASNPKGKGECFMDIYRESKHYEVTEKPNQVKFLGKHINNETPGKNAGPEPPKPAPWDKQARVEKFMNSNSMKTLLAGDANERFMPKKGQADNAAIVQATKNQPTTHKRNSNYKHMVASNGQIIYKD